DTDRDRMSSMPSMPLSASSIGTVTSASTSAADRPRHSVCTSTRGGANSGNTSTGTSRNRAIPKAISSEAATTTTNRSRRLVAMIRRIMGTARRSRSLARAELGAVEHRRAYRDNRRAGGRSAGHDHGPPVEYPDVDLLSQVRLGLDHLVHPG